MNKLIHPFRKNIYKNSPRKLKIRIYPKKFKIANRLITKSNVLNGLQILKLL